MAKTIKMQTIEEWPVDKLIEYARNPRKNDHAVDRVASAIREFGFRVPILAKSDGSLIDGHLRLKAARKLGMDTVPVLLADDMTDVQVKAFRLSINKMAELAEWDEELLALEFAELEEMDFDLGLTGFEDIDFDKFLEEEQEEIEKIEDVSEQLPGAMALKVDMEFVSNLPWNIPELKADMLAGVPPNLKTWAGPDATPDDGKSYYMWNWRTDSLKGSPKDRLMIGFYTDDCRFEQVWGQPDKYVSQMLNLGVSVALTPNFSLWSDQAEAIHLWATYKTRWLGRYMQEAGIAVIPDVNWASEESFKFCLLGIPKNPPAIAVQLQTVKTDEEIRAAIYGVKRAIKELNPQAIIVYGHKCAVKIMDEVKFTGVIHFLENRTALRRIVMNRGNEDE